MSHPSQCSRRMGHPTRTQQSLFRSRLPMIPVERLGKWTLIGVPAILMEGIVVTVLIHLRYLIAWRDLLLPVVLCLVIQVGFFVGAFFAGKLAREQRRFGPISFLVGFSLWGTVLVVMHYGPLWGILPVVGDPISFSVWMVFVTFVSWFVTNKLRPK